VLMRADTFLRRVLLETGYQIPNPPTYTNCPALALVGLAICPGPWEYSGVLSAVELYLSRTTAPWARRVNLVQDCNIFLAPGYLSRRSMVPLWVVGIDTDMIYFIF